MKKLFWAVPLTWFLWNLFTDVFLHRLYNGIVKKISAIYSLTSTLHDNASNTPNMNTTIKLDCKF
jgi:hypothetical protein